MSQKNSKSIYFLTGSLFLIGYWIFGYDGITFSDDVYYMQFGRDFWKGLELRDSSHFTERWGAFLFSGLFTHLFGYTDRWASVPSLISYLVSFYLLLHLKNENSYRFWLTLFFCTQVYFLHFLPKVYPDSILVLWVILVPFTAVYRQKYPFWMGMTMAATFMIGFATKETMVLLLPFPFLIFFFDWKNGNNLSFYKWFGAWSILILGIYFFINFIKYQNAFFHIDAIHSNYYTWEFSYHDKGWDPIFKRITHEPILVFVLRSFWIWIVFSISGMVIGISTKEKIVFEFAMAALCLIFGFWFMSSSLEFYNPIYMNPRHLIILVGPLSVLVAMSAKDWINKPHWKIRISVLIALGIFVGFILKDLKMAAYITGMGLLFIFFSDHQLFKPAFVLLMIFPVVASIYFQIETKNYPHFKEQFNQYVSSTDTQTPIITNNFVYSSREILLSDAPALPKNLCQVGDWEKIMSQNPGVFKLFVYKYYQHAYPEEQEFLTSFDSWLSTSTYKIVEEFEDDWIQTKTFRIISSEGLFQSFLSPCSENPVDIESYPEFISGSTIAACQ